MTTHSRDPVALVTGAARRVGAEIARHLHGAGFNVVVHYRSAVEDAIALVDTLNHSRQRSAIAIRGDLLRIEDCAGLVDQSVRVFGRLDALVNNASSFFATPIGGITDRDFEDLAGSNFRAPLFLSQASAAHLRASGGAIVNIVDIHADRPLRRYPVYSAAKAGLVGLTRALAIELAPEVRVNGVAPGPIQWPDDGSFDADERARIIERTLLKRCGEPSDIARAVLFFVRDAPYVTGQILAVDGGRSVVL